LILSGLFHVRKEPAVARFPAGDLHTTLGCDDSNQTDHFASPAITHHCSFQSSGNGFSTKNNNAKRYQIVLSSKTNWRHFGDSDTLDA